MAFLNSEELVLLRRMLRKLKFSRLSAEDGNVNPRACCTELVAVSDSILQRVNRELGPESVEAGLLRMLWKNAFRTRGNLPMLTDSEQWAEVQRLNSEVKALISILEES